MPPGSQTDVPNRPRPRRAGCYPGSHSLKINDDFDNVCLSRHTRYLSVPAATLTATLVATHRQLVRDLWWASREGSERRGLTDPALQAGASAGSVPESTSSALYDRGDDHIELWFGPANADFLTRMTYLQEIHQALWDPYWSDKHLLDEPALRAAAAGRAVIAVAAEVSGSGMADGLVHDVFGLAEPADSEGRPGWERAGRRCAIPARTGCWRPVTTSTTSASAGARAT